MARSILRTADLLSGRIGRPAGGRHPALARPILRRTRDRVKAGEHPGEATLRSSVATLLRAKALISRFGGVTL
jgi:hypothetical protein